METRVRLLLVLGGLPPPVVQYEVFDRDGRVVARLDLAYPALRVGIEYDGDQHRDRAVFRRVDVGRQAQTCWGSARRSASGTGGSYSRTTSYRVLRSTGRKPASQMRCSRSSRCITVGVP